MVVTSTILNKIERYINKTQINKSSYWRRQLQNKDYKDIYAELGFGSYTEINKFKTILHYILSRITYPNYIFKTEVFYKIKKLYSKTNRQIDNDTLRHVFTFNLLKNFKFNNACVIGDGKANFVIQYLALFNNKKIYSINLAETLYNDYKIIKKMGINDKLIKFVEKPKDLDSSCQIYLIPSINKNFCFNKKIDLFVNIDSFQEMKKEEIKRYFKIIKSNRSLLYCCNRQCKELPSGEKILFNDYAWDYKYKFKECPWEKKYYSLSFPFINSYQGKHFHTLIDFKKNIQLF